MRLSDDMVPMLLMSLSVTFTHYQYITLYIETFYILRLKLGIDDTSCILDILGICST